MALGITLLLCSVSADPCMTGPSLRLPSEVPRTQDRSLQAAAREASFPPQSIHLAALRSLQVPPPSARRRGSSSRAEASLTCFFVCFFLLLVLGIYWVPNKCSCKKGTTSRQVTKTRKWLKARGIHFTGLKGVAICFRPSSPPPEDAGFLKVGRGLGGGLQTLRKAPMASVEH